MDREGGRGEHIPCRLMKCRTHLERGSVVESSEMNRAGEEAVRARELSASCRSLPPPRSRRALHYSTHSTSHTPAPLCRLSLTPPRSVSSDPLPLPSQPLTNGSPPLHPFIGCTTSIGNLCSFSLRRRFSFLLYRSSCTFLLASLSSSLALTPFTHIHLPTPQASALTKSCNCNSSVATRVGFSLLFLLNSLLAWLMLTDWAVKAIARWSYDYIKMECTEGKCYGVLAVSRLA